MEAAAVSLQSAYERAEASLDLASQRVESEFSRSCTDQRLNPARLMRRIRALQDELPKLQKADDARVCIVGSVTGNKNTVAGSLVKPVGSARERERGLDAPRERFGRRSYELHARVRSRRAARILVAGGGCGRA